MRIIKITNDELAEQNVPWGDEKWKIKKINVSKSSILKCMLKIGILPGSFCPGLTEMGRIWQVTNVTKLYSKKLTQLNKRWLNSEHDKKRMLINKNAMCGYMFFVLTH